MSSIKNGEKENEKKIKYKKGARKLFQKAWPSEERDKITNLHRRKEDFR